MHRPAHLGSVAAWHMWKTTATVPLHAKPRASATKIPAVWAYTPIFIQASALSKKPAAGVIIPEQSRIPPDHQKRPRPRFLLPNTRMPMSFAVAVCRNCKVSLQIPGWNACLYGSSPLGASTATSFMLIALEAEPCHGVVRDRKPNVSIRPLRQTETAQCAGAALPPPHTPSGRPYRSEGQNSGIVARSHPRRSVADQARRRRSRRLTAKDTGAFPRRPSPISPSEAKKFVVCAFRDVPVAADDYSGLGPTMNTVSVCRFSRLRSVRASYGHRHAGEKQRSSLTGNGGRTERR